MEEIKIFDTDIGIHKDMPLFFSHAKTKEIPSDSSYHMHESLEIYIYVSGDVDFLVENTYHRLKSGDIIFTLPNELHRAVIRNATEYERFYVQIPLSAFSFLPQSAAKPLDRFLHAKKGERIIHSDEKERHEMLRLLTSISERIRFYPVKYTAFADLLYFLELLNQSKTSQPKETVSSGLIAEVLRYIQDNCLTLSGVHEIAAHFHVHPSYLSTAFSHTVHTGLKQYLIHKKIAAAKEMLLGGENTTEVCYKTGFGSSSHFISTFRAIVGCTPGEYRKRHQI